jgi:hypothetical protein
MARRGEQVAAIERCEALVAIEAATPTAASPTA